MRFLFLVVDSFAVDRELTASRLASIVPSSEVLTVESAEAAIDLLQERRVVPSLTFLEQTLPGLSGLEFLSEVRHRRWLDRMPVVMLTGNTSDRLVVSAYRLGASAFVTKPVRPFELRQCIREFAEPALRMAAGSIVPRSGTPTHTTTAA